MGIDLRELRTVTASIAARSAAVTREGAAVVARGALNIKNDWRTRARVTAGAHARHYPNSISYDVTEAPGVTVAEIGPDKHRPQGPLGNILEFGTSTQAGHNDGGQALDAEEPLFQAQVDALSERALSL